VAVVTPAGELRTLDDLISKLETASPARERKVYLPDFPGFSKVFGARVVRTLNRELPASLERDLSLARKPHALLAQRLSEAITSLEVQRGMFDIIIIYLPDRFSAGFEGQDDDFDLHDFVKSRTAILGMPCQIVREGSAIKYRCRASVSWRLGIALYAKAGGIPWKLADSDPQCAFIGLSYALRSPKSHSSQFVTCCSQVFDSDGAGLEFVAYETPSAQVEGDNPFLPRAEMRRIMARSLALYQKRHAGQTPRRVVVHKTTEFKPEEVDGCFDALNSAEEIELIQVKQNGMWRGVALASKSSPTGYPVERGTYLQMGDREVLLWTQGNAPTAVKGSNYYKEGKGTPSPLELVRFTGHGGFEENCRDVLGLTKMNWNNDSLYDRLPVTLSFAQVLARTVKRMGHLGPDPYSFRFFM
jgi:argonaute-like protein implicated in RNA metabolism and viral defense